MADPLSIAASLAGLLSITIELGKIFGPYVSAAKDTPQIALRVYSEIQSTQAILAGLQKLTGNLASTNIQHAALISVNQLVAILTDGVLIFSELEDLIQSLIPQGGAGQRLPLLVRLQWVREEGTLNSLLTRLQAFKSSMNLMLVILMRFVLIVYFDAFSVAHGINPSKVILIQQPYNTRHN
jgi:cell division control protein 24